ncbi:hypothetical protein A2276_00365 [candidate division WOR-1 bacterium RIFOXYA12_FULL_43_27]|uniref:Cytochrome C biogenesis protein transmembrane domain-containing protein n=1 Tax=candidate division WOR-1 bacterium RIFOXYC2_FULL_46_14 TaxID=1802587 RepID=A0A1F4U4L6_UNCSA|nr:MAG: hypothetical protein A2276_00365 [candidate division WOR-1 bacterium RIFOXYA12_FULL_43_27]OGC20850.1 MAG: hypothetical protein A2292_07510 [candidate division WOR-1 bacterium RIFOXYB2_FULL_46_45]OGC31413.1 MAG: hypothetical protein A2232_03940 [candidate division WOR-1 bacterium RIFOXYA2_FULL_46_56]OGC39819.1 MAG: hypothetical protein A2438_04775 [candidate division WOR-1 bacterium RIFOXYC2_FULL_46_14]
MSFLAVFFAGIAASLSPCVLTTYPLIISYVGGYSEGDSKRAFSMSLFFVIGLSITYSILGTVAALSGKLIGDIGPFWKYFLSAILIVMGLDLLQIIHLKLPGFRGLPIKQKGIPGALFLGMIFGLTASACSTPILGVVLTYVASRQNVAYGSLLLFVYALGSSLIVLAVGASTGFAQANLKIKRFEKISVLLPKIAGIAFILLGIWYAVV